MCLHVRRTSIRARRTETDSPVKGRDGELLTLSLSLSLSLPPSLPPTPLPPRFISLPLSALHFWFPCWKFHPTAQTVSSQAHTLTLRNLGFLIVKQSCFLSRFCWLIGTAPWARTTLEFGTPTEARVKSTPKLHHDPRPYLIKWDGPHWISHSRWARALRGKAKF